MTHHPIKEQRKPGWLEQVVIEPGTQGLLYQKGQYIRTLNPGDRPSPSERLASNLLLYIVDVAPHTFTWRVNLPAAHHEDAFPTTITLRYRINDALGIAADAVTDTEASVIHALEPELRKVSRLYTLDQHITADSELEAYLRRFDFASRCHVELLERPTVIFDFGDAEWRRIKALENTERATRVAQVAEHTVELPTSEAAYKFIAIATVSYKVCDPTALPTDTLADAERQLWPQVQRILRHASRAYKVTDVAQAEDGIQDAIDARLVDKDDQKDGKKGIKDFGLEVLSVEVNVNQDDTAQIHAAQLALAEHEAKLGAQKLETALARQPIFDELISKGSWAALAWAVANGKVSEEELYQQMSQAESEQLKLKIALLERLRNDDARSEAQDASASSALLESVVRDVTGRSVPSLPAAGSRPKLPGDKGEGA